MKKPLQIIARIVALPLVLLLLAFARIRDMIKFAFLWVRHGGELLVYDEDINPKTIHETVRQLNVQLLQKAERIAEIEKIEFAELKWREACQKQKLECHRNAKIERDAQGIRVVDILEANEPEFVVHA